MGCWEERGPLVCLGAELSPSLWDSRGLDFGCHVMPEGAPSGWRSLECWLLLDLPPTKLGGHLPTPGLRRPKLLWASKGDTGGSLVWEGQVWLCQAGTPYLG